MAVLSLFSHPSHFQEDGRNYVLVRTRFSPCSPGPGYGYSYAYDGLNRLVLAQSLDSRGSGTGIANNHSSWYDYDLMGNVTSVVRNGLLRPAFSFGRMDELSLEYDGNRLVKVTDGSEGFPLYHNAFHYVDGSDAAVEFEYDANGNLTADLDKGVELSYNRLNLPVEAVCGEGAFVYRYDRNGAKLVERFGYGLSSSDGMLMPVSVGLSAQPLSVAGEYRFDEAAYSGDIVRLRSGTGRIGDRADNLTGEELQVRHADGYVSFTGQLPTYHYFIRDYQGNVVVVVSSEGDVEQRTHYYPYGGWYGESTEPLLQERKYGGKELELTAGVNWYDFGARLQRPDLCRFQTMDPLAEKYYGVSPYAYCMGNPVRYVDPSGMDVWQVDASGNIIERLEDEREDAFELVWKDADGNYNPIMRYDGETDEYGPVRISFAYGTVEEQRTIAIDSETSYDVYRVRGDENGTRLFEFFADNTNVEWSHSKNGKIGSGGLNFITTSHGENNELGMKYLYIGQLKNDYIIRELNHNHPNQDNRASGKTIEPTTQEMPGTWGDMGFSIPIINNCIKAGKPIPKFNIYTSHDRKYTSF